VDEVGPTVVEAGDRLVAMIQFARGAASPAALAFSFLPRIDRAHDVSEPRREGFEADVKTAGVGERSSGASDS
jgi:hypothetical protein